jgi:DNA-binding XRE family transcriptional regulator
MDAIIEQARDAKRRMSRERQRRSAEQQLAAQLVGLSPETLAALRAMSPEDLAALGGRTAQVVGVGGTASNGEVGGA